MIEKLTPEQRAKYEPYFYSNYVKKLISYDQRIGQDVILDIEKATRGQTTNHLWNLLRLERQTASNSGASARFVPMTVAMSHGHVQEHEVKKCALLMDELKRLIETELNTQVVETVLESGMFISSMGLHSASPDAYFKTRENILIPLEIKCPYTYRDTNYMEIQQSLRQKKKRYRIKGTAFSLNHEGDPVFAVEPADPHYRQMQRQMYVMNSPICLYLVKFGDSTVTRIVYRDDPFCNQEHLSENAQFRMIVGKNKSKIKYRIETKRFETFKNLDNFTEEEKAALAANGIYHEYGTLTCAFCHESSDCDSPAGLLCYVHEQCSMSKENERNINVMFPSFFPNHIRAYSLPQEFEQFSKQGLFYDRSTKTYKTFCCGLTLDTIEEGKIKHRDNCEFNKYYLMLK
ncbi:ALK-EXO [Rachiplusia nu nucleopolyhedrovirus]|uniref:ALK-EXO n=1 Tax=Rachiplusia nu nucleopolyhedrovirus TaxID=2605775 RepID=A0AAE6IQP2_9ABAC|nr:ALK-EXO [Rachiplusia nu nucleopolyhedrovirus]QEI03628.1 ALK-EXO [Rachiplusia nu nucleopolyhedrovirus]